MEMLRISGREYPARPPSKGGQLSQKRRLLLIVQSLRFASETCSETERALYKTILQALAHAENSRDRLTAAPPIDPELSDLQRPEHEP